MKFPFPLQPIAPVKVQVPVISPFCTVPFRLRTFPSAPIMVYWKLPDTWPLKFPCRVNDPVSVVVDGKHCVLFAVKVKLLDPSEPSARTVSSVLKANVSGPVLLSVAAQFPLILPATCEFEPQPASTRITTSRMSEGDLISSFDTPCFRFGRRRSVSKWALGAR